ncbi:hypothetical protein [Dyella sp.]
MMTLPTAALDDIPLHWVFASTPGRLLVTRRIRVAGANLGMRSLATIT